MENKKYGHDMPERRLTQSILQDSETRYRRLFETAQDGILILDAKTGQIDDVNPFLTSMLGYSHKEFMGKKLWEIGLFKDIISSQASFKKLQSKGYIRYEDLPLETKDGRHIAVEFVSNVYLVDHTKVIQCNIRDITARKQAEEAVKYSEQKLRAIFEAIPSIVLIMDDQLKVRAVNKAFRIILGVSPDKIINQRWGDALKCIHAKETPDGCGFSLICQSCHIRGAVLASLLGNETSRTKMKFEFSANGQTQKRLLTISAAPIEYEDNKMAVLTVEDITELSYLRERLRVEHSFSGIVGRDEKMQELYNAIRELAESNASVLIQGESGTGKELVASAIHNEGPRRNKQFVPVNCGALPDGLLESELFGHVKGAFTGAIRDKKGRFELAHNGTIFLDEIGDLSQAMQVKLLRVLQDGSFEPVGSEKTMKVDVRVISATNKDIKQEIKSGRFREDLFYRLCVVPLTIPPLRERINDVPLLATRFLEWSAMEYQKEKMDLLPEALDILMSYHWAGNVRELQNVLQFALVKCRGNVIKPEHLPSSISQNNKHPAARRRRKGKLDFKSVEDALQKTHGNKLKAAKLLGVSRATIHRFLAEKK
jgi:PAS domain S-box-containing protein